MNIIHNITIKTSAERWFAAITTQNGLAGWFTPDVKAEPKIGASIELRFDANRLSFRVEQAESPRRVVWAPVQAPPEWQPSRITFEAKPEAGAIDFTFTHTGLPENYSDYGFFTYCWGQYVRSLKLLLETGSGEPYGSPAARAWHPLS